MSRCLQLAVVARDTVAPNPMVGAVIVAPDGRVIAEGFHSRPGTPHAEIHALQNVREEDRALLPSSTLYVNLEPCHHHGRTPPCTLAIREAGIRRLVIAGKDPNPLVSGKGVEYLKSAGLDVKEGVLQEEAERLNRSFLIFHRKKRPYIILKWAETDDFFIGDPERRILISGMKSQILTHLWRSEVDAILVGTNTALIDDPSLTVRHIVGRSPQRILFDRTGKVPKTHKLFQDDNPLYIITENPESFATLGNQKHVVHLPFAPSVLPPFLEWAYRQEIQTLLVEGGRKLLQSFVNAGFWDEARILHSTNKILKKGIRCPKLKGELVDEIRIDADIIRWVKQ